MAVTATEFKARFPEFGELPDATVDRWLDEAARNLSTSQWNDLYDDGQAYMTAHLIVTFENLTLGTPEPGAGPVTSEKEGQVAVSISPLVIAEAFRKDSFSGTKYGRRYRELLRAVFVTRCT
jgi:hypothetical protein